MSEKISQVKELDILLVEDDLTIRTVIKAVLEKNGDRVAVAGTAKLGEEKAMEGQFDIIILDLNLPDGNGYEICERIRQRKIKTPVLFLSAEQDTDVKVKCLEVGGDDYLTKPFEHEELVARIAAIIRRSSYQKDGNELICGELKVDVLARNVFIKEKKVSLTNNEFSLLVYFLRNRNRVISQEELARNVWDIHFDTQTNYINVYISYLRKKIRNHTSTEYIATIRTKGFVLKCEG